MWQRWCLKLPIIPDLREITIKVDFSPIFAPTTIQLTFTHFSNEPGTQEGKIARHESRAPDYQERKTQLKTHTLQGFFHSHKWPHSRCNTRQQFSGSTILACTCNNSTHQSLHLLHLFCPDTTRRLVMLGAALTVFLIKDGGWVNKKVCVVINFVLSCQQMTTPNKQCKCQHSQSFFGKMSAK